MPVTKIQDVIFAGLYLREFTRCDLRDRQAFSRHISRLYDFKRSSCQDALKNDWCQTLTEVKAQHISFPRKGDRKSALLPKR
ncbi:MAG: hypothetical protein DMG89_09005 [Acidobacteria bacterium]|nr:MAG: hypothetical protein DMG89_09005 [Acidobacteriota bacterium]